MGILEQLEAGLRAGLGIPEARTGIPRLEVDEEVEVEDTFEGLLRTVGVFSLLSGGSTGETDLVRKSSHWSGCEGRKWAGTSSGQCQFFCTSKVSHSGVQNQSSPARFHPPIHELVTCDWTLGALPRAVVD